MLLTQCNNPTPEKLCGNADTRGKIISALMNNDAYTHEVMDTMRAKHPDVILSTIFVIAKNDKSVQESMMNNMMDMCSSDSFMCKMMMSKTMDMCDTDQGKCIMMSGMMMNHKHAMKCMMSEMNEARIMDKSHMEKGMMNMMGEPEKKGKPEDHLKLH